MILIRLKMGSSTVLHFRRWGRGRGRRVARREVVSRRGAAVAEFAICLPVMTLVVFGGIETADMVFLKENLQSVAYEGARTASQYDSDNAEVLARMTDLIDARQVKEATITLQLPEGADDVSELTRGQIIQVTVSAPAERNTVGPLKIYQERTIRATTLMVRE